MIMTKHLRIFLALILLMAVSVAKASTLYYVVDNIRYAVNTDDSTAMVVAYSAYKDMTEITIPASITVHGYAYRVTELGEYCFERCTGLTNVTIPNSVTELGYGCFSLCNLESMHIQSKTPPQTSIEGSFQLRIDYITLYVPVGSADAYKAATPWKYFKEIIEE